jgi:hypothetical protein
MGKACADHEVHFTISRWIAAMLSNGMVRAEIKGVISTKMFHRGCLQGGVLSSLLWNVVIKSLLGCLNNESLWAQGFADDIAIVINGKFLSTVCEHMQKALFSVQIWEVGLSVNADKTSMVLFTNNRKLVGFKKPILFETQLQLKNQVKYLGVIIDEEINWNSQIDHKMQKATIAFWKC